MNSETERPVYQNLLVWQKAMDLIVEVYRLIKYLPNEERYALSDQMRRSVVSIASNIAEGAGRKTSLDFGHFLVMARGSKYEIETQLLICNRLGYIHKEQIQKAFELSNEIGKMLNALLRKLESESKN